MTEVMFSVEFQEINSTFDAEFNALDQSFESDFGTLQEVMVGGAKYHEELMNRDAPDQHPISAITGLVTELDSKLESDTVPTLSNTDIENLLKGFV